MILFFYQASIFFGMPYFASAITILTILIIEPFVLQAGVKGTLGRLVGVFEVNVSLYLFLRLLET